MSSISEKGQVAVPKEWREALRLKARSKVVFISDGGEALIRRTQVKRPPLLESHQSRVPEKGRGRMGLKAVIEAERDR